MRFQDTSRFTTGMMLSYPLTTLLVFNSSLLNAQQTILEEIIVTAQKREQNMMDVPVVLTAVSPKDLKVFGIRDSADLTKISPSLTYDQTELAQNSGFRIRGIGTVVYSVSAEIVVVQTRSNMETKRFRVCLLIMGP